jgi:hypothetical protein
MLLKVVNKFGLVLDLPDKVNISVERNNSLFNDSDKLFQDMVYAFTAPYTDNNDLFFKGGKLIETAVDDYLLTGNNFYSVGTPLLNGNIRYAIRPDGYEVNLEPNLFVLNSLVTGVRITEIQTEDADYSITTPEAMAVRMLDTCQHPDKYGYIYVPVQNMGWAAGAFEGSVYHYINYFDFTPGTFRFVTTPPAGATVAFTMAFSPYFKLSYILKQIAGYLGLVATGSFFTSAKTKNICIYNRVGNYKYDVLPCMMYMPNMLLSDFIKLIRKRFHLAIDFDLITGEMTVATFSAMASTKKVVDLTPFVGDVTEQEMPDKKGYRVTLKADQQDALFIIKDIDDNDTFPAEFTLVSGAGDTEDEIDCGTLKEVIWAGPAGVIHPATDQTVFNVKYYVAGFPDDLVYKDQTDPTTYNDWPLRLFDYKGYLPVAGGYFPVARSLNFNQDDIDYYQFMADAKRLIITNYIPASVLGNFKVTDTYAHMSTGLNYRRYIAEQNAYGVTNENKLIGTKVTALTLDNPKKTRVTIIPYTAPNYIDAINQVAYRLKAYFDPELHGIDVLTMDLVNIVTGVHGAIDPIRVPTNKNGAGGLGVSLFNAIDGVNKNFEIRIKQGRPKYLLHRGVRTNFTQAVGYYTVIIDVNDTAGSNLFAPYIIFF